MARGATRAAATKKSKVVRIDFTGVETASVVPEGEYIVAVKSAKLEESTAGNEYVAWQLTINDGKHQKKTLYQNTSLTQNSLWATKRWLECLGMEVPDGEFDLDLEEPIGTTIGVVVEHEDYKGRTRSRIVDCFPAEDGASGEGADEGGDEGDDGPGEVPTADDVAEMGKAELRELVEKFELDVELSGTTAAQRRQMIKALADYTPPKSESKGGGKTTTKKKKKLTADEVQEMDDEALEETVETYELDVKLEKLPNMRRKRSAVIDALEEADMLEEEDA